jgi:hypothetical protein
MVFSELHATPIAGHLGFTEPYDRFKRSFFGDGMKQDIHTFLVEFDVFQRNNEETVKPPAHYNHFRFHPLFGGISLWISLLTYLNQAIS